MGTRPDIIYIFRDSEILTTLVSRVGASEADRNSYLCILETLGIPKSNLTPEPLCNFGVW